jgi:hypothetical protein
MVGPFGHGGCTASLPVLIAVTTGGASQQVTSMYGRS